MSDKLNIFTSDIPKNHNLKDNIKLFLKTRSSLIIVDKNDMVLERNFLSNNFRNFMLENDNSFEMCELSVVKELCNKRIVNLFHGLLHYFALTLDGKVYSWGNNKFGQLGHETNDKNFKDFHEPKVINSLSALQIVDLKCGYFHSLALSQSGEVYFWGSFDRQVVKNCVVAQFTPIKVNGFNDEKVIMISCGGSHSMALTESKQVFSWGYNSFGQLGIGTKKNTNKPKRIKLDGVKIHKICCGYNHSLLLSEEGDIYAFGNNNFGQIGNGNKGNVLKPFKLNLKERIIDIATHFDASISLCLSNDDIIYCWGSCDFNEGSLIPVKTSFKSFNELFSHYYNLSIEVSDEIIGLSHLRNGMYQKCLIEMEKRGEGSFGEVFEVKNKAGYFHAVKKIIFTQENRRQFVNEFINTHFIYLNSNQYAHQHFNFWLEQRITDNKLILYLPMELCDKTLRNIMYEINTNSNTTCNGKLTAIGFHVVIRLFFEIVEKVQHLHKNDIIHRDLNPENIMLKDNGRSLFPRDFIKIIDFGLIAIHESADQTHSLERGQVRYMAPEVGTSGSYDTKADIYSLGIILKEMIQFDEERFANFH
jgi:hypothetical protein